MLIPLSGCLSPVSLDAYGYVISVGVDRGKEKAYYFTFALQRALSEQNLDSEGGAILLAAEGNSVFEAVNELEDNVPYSLNFSRTNFIIAGRKIAEAGEIRDLVSTSFDSLKIRTSAVIIVADCPVSDFIGGMYSNNDANIGKLQSALMLDREKTGMVSIMSVSRLLEACSDSRFDYSTALGNYDPDTVTDTEQKKSESEGKNPLEDVETGDRAGGLKSFISGTALFSGWRMTGVLDREETMFLDMVTGEFENGVITLVYDGEGEGRGSFVSVLLSLEKCRVAVNDDLSVSAEIKLTAGIHRKDERISSAEMDEWLTERLKTILEGRMNEVFLKCREAGSDAMRFGTKLIRKFRDYGEWERFDWRERYKSFEPEFSVTVLNADKYIEEDMQ